MKKVYWAKTMDPASIRNKEIDIVALIPNGVWAAWGDKKVMHDQFRDCTCLSLIIAPDILFASCSVLRLFVMPCLLPQLLSVSFFFCSAGMAFSDSFLQSPE